MEAFKENTAEIKKQLRRVMREARDAYPEEDRRRDTDRLIAKIIESAAYQRADSLLVYAAFGSEIDLSALMRTARVRGKVTALPKMTGPHEMRFYRVEEGTPMKAGKWGIMEPDTDGADLPEVNDGLMLLPGLAFDRDFHRMGYGGGYYDRFISRYREDLYLMAPILQLQMIDHVPCEAHDALLDAILTPEESYYRNRF